MSIAIKTITSVSIYCFIIFVSYHLMKNNERTNKQGKLPIMCITIVSLLCSFLNRYLSHGRAITGGDRANYLYDFEGRLTGFLGFDTYLRITHYFTEDFNLVLYTTTFICCTIMLISYWYSDDSKSPIVLILFCTPFVLNTFVNLKQCFACAFASIMFATISKPKNVKHDLICVLCIVFACLFHTTGYLLIPIFLILRFNKTINFKIAVISIISIALFLQPVMLFIASHAASLLPNLSNKLNEYFMEESIRETDGSTIAFIKGTPFYIATILGLFRRGAYKKCDEKYDMYLLILCIGSVTYACSLISYWLIRLISILYFPVSIAIYKVISLERNPKNRLLENIIVVGGLAFFTIRSLALNILNYGGY